MKKIHGEVQNLNLICQTETSVTKTIDKIGNWWLNN